MIIKPGVKCLLLLCVVSLLWGSCSSNQSGPVERSDLQDDFQVDRAEVLNDLRELLQSMDSVAVSAKPGRFRSLRAEPRSFSDADVELLGNFPRVYLVNFDRQQGYAILAADKRVREPLIVLTDRGSLDRSTLDSVLNDISDEDVRYKPEQMILRLVRTYLEENCVPRYENSLPRQLDSGWMTIEEVKPMVRTLWGQSAPFNDSAPIKRKNRWSAYRKCPAGCVPLALSQLITYHAYPKNFVCQGQTMDYALLGSVFAADAVGDISFGPYDQSVNRMAAGLCREVGNLCGAMYHPDWTLVLPAGAASCLKKLTYPSVVLHKGYQEERILGMLAEGNPVPVFAMDNSFHGHAWLMDGMIKRQNRAEISMQQILLHCNFGWWGAANGYYASGIFDTRQGTVLRQNHEAIFGARASYSFMWSFYQISYANPQ